MYDCTIEQYSSFFSSFKFLLKIKIKHKNVITQTQLILQLINNIIIS